jgi:pyridoxal phosphate enzyme (YggS family)
MLDRYQQLRQRIRDTAARYGRDPQAVQLLAVSKRQPISKIRAAADCGQRRFGENYLQEAEAKITSLAALSLEWHFIGQLQSNKTRQVAALFDWVHSVDRVKIAERLNDQRPASAAPLKVCVEVNLGEERTKGGIGPQEVPGFVARIRDLPRLRVRGLMALPPPEADFERQRQRFRQLYEIFAAIEGQAFDTLSMGTSNDFEAAIAEGSTMVRIGTALFGERH